MGLSDAARVFGLAASRYEPLLLRCRQRQDTCFFCCLPGAGSLFF